MEVVFTGEEMPEKFTKSIFLAGPSLRPGQEKELESWRKDALDILKDKGYDGVVFCPENRDFKFKNKDFNYDSQIEWEDKYLNIADCIVFWVPRDLSLDKNDQPKLPAFTTNIEWGAWADTGKVVFGAPKGADKVDYLKYYADKYNVPMSETLVETLDNAIEMLGDGIERSGGQRYVPLFIWNQDSFQTWYQAQIGAENRLEEARLLYTFRPGYKKFVFLWILKVKVYISSEDRYKDNEFVLARPDISTVLMWKKDLPLENSEIVLIKEFRSPASTEDGFIHELPSGSSPIESHPKETAAEEIYEETGLMIDVFKLNAVSSKQICGTLSSHKAHLYSYELDDEELEWLKSQKNIAHGKEEDTERTFIEVVTLKQLFKNNLTDWATLGQIFSIIYKQ